MKENLYAYTAPGCEYPGYVSINRTEAGIEVSVREVPTLVNGIRVCGQTCTPGGPHCNNYCNEHPDKSLPMADSAELHTFYREGHTVSFTVPESEWPK